MALTDLVQEIAVDLHFGDLKSLEVKVHHATLRGRKEIKGDTTLKNSESTSILSYQEIFFFVFVILMVFFNFSSRHRKLM